MEYLYTKEGWPLRRDGRRLFSSSGAEVARLRDDRAYGADGRYVGTIVNERLVYRPMHAGRTASSFLPSHRMGFSRMRRMGRLMSGSEPPIEH